MATSTPSSCCAHVTLPLAKLLASLAINVIGIPAVGILIPTTQRPLPVQEIPIGAGAPALLPHPDYVHGFIEDRRASCPSLVASARRSMVGHHDAALAGASMFLSWRSVNAWLCWPKSASIVAPPRPRAGV